MKLECPECQHVYHREDPLHNNVNSLSTCPECKKAFVYFWSDGEASCFTFDWANEKILEELGRNTRSLGALHMADILQQLAVIWREGNPNEIRATFTDRTFHEEPNLHSVYHFKPIEHAGTRYTITIKTEEE